MDGKICAGLIALGCVVGVPVSLARAAVDDCPTAPQSGILDVKICSNAGVNPGTCGSGSFMPNSGDSVYLMRDTINNWLFACVWSNSSGNYYYRRLARFNGTLITTNTQADDYYMCMGAASTYTFVAGSASTCVGEGFNITTAPWAYGGYVLALYAQGGADTVVGAAGEEYIRGGSGGIFGSEDLRGGSGDDNIYGESGSDFIEGGAGNDHIDGDTGSDWVIDTSGSSDELYGGDDNEACVKDCGGGFSAHNCGAGSADIYGTTYGSLSYCEHSYACYSC